MTKALIMSLGEWQMTQEQPRPVTRVVLQVGDFTCVEPHLLLTSFATQRSRQPWLQNAELVIKTIPFIAHCETCMEDYQPQIGHEYRCPHCAAPLHHIRSGRELKIETVEWQKEQSYVQ